MYLIGTVYLRLKFLFPWGSLGLCFLLTVNVFALDRSLTSEEVDKLNKNIATDPENLKARRFLIDHYAKENNWQDLITIAQPIQKSLPATEQLLLVRTYLKTGDAKSALAVIGFYQSQYGSTSDSKLLEAQALTQLADHDQVEISRRQKAVEIITVLRESLRLDPQNKDAYFSWINVLKTFWTSYAEDALQVYHLLETATKSPLSYLDEKCALLVEATLWDQALEICKKSIRQEDADQDSYIHLAKAQAIKETLQDSKTTLQELAKRFPESANAHKALAKDYFTENNFISSAEHFKKATELTPDDAESYLFLAQAEFRQKKYNEALDAFTKNCQLSRTLASEFKHSTGELRSLYPLHHKYKNAMSSCQK